MTKLKLVSAGLIVAAMFASPTIARESHAKARRTAHAYAALHRAPVASKRGCVRAPDIGAYATAPWRQPPCEPAASY
ncbi:conserved exported hypothetical protein [Bradyrhizobium sp. STM 3843]|uniref:hypothetical protein n=1 Tax=Bradyrhizobium sp. STM 3843 TaxID=551947 RepID=UPI000240373E|nr:hypothetical protein [Bradyrhizobium sp. STM 3843]CCE10834.1 conserved exported hypothetical protein [Bradyrhizobium sp. STM 3843]